MGPSGKFAALRWRRACVLAVRGACLLHVIAGNTVAAGITQPQGETRLIEFSTDQGTGMSVDIAADGGWLVFDLLAQIYRVPPNGGAAECLTQGSGIALNYHPKISPDGNRIAFVSDRNGQSNLWLMDADGGNPRPLSEDADTAVAEPAWTPDANAIVAVRMYPHAFGPWSRRNELWWYPVNGGEPRKLATPANKLVYSPSISPDGRHVYYHSSSLPVIGEGYYKIGTDHEIRRIELETGIDRVVSATASRRYYHREPFYAFAPSVSPDGKWLAFARRVPGGVTKHGDVRYGQRTGLWVRDLESGEERLVVDRIAPDQLETHTMYQVRLVPGYAWAGDSGSLVYSSQGGLARSYLANGRRERIPFEATVRREISALVRPQFRVEEPTLRLRFFRWPALSPDGKRLIFEAAGSLWLDRVSQTNPQRLVPADGGGPVTVELTPAWSPDGRTIAYTTWSDEEGGHVWAIDVASGERRRLTTTAGEYLNPAWYPDGRALAVARGSGAGLRGEGTARSAWNEILRIPLNNGPAQTLVRGLPNAGKFMAPQFADDGRIYYLDGDASAPAPANSTLRSMRGDGTDRRSHASFVNATHVAVSPDREWLAVGEAERVFLAAFPDSGAASEPLVDWQGDDPAMREIGDAGGFFPQWNVEGILTFVSGSTVIRSDPAEGNSERHAVELAVERRVPVGTLALVNARVVTFGGRGVIERGSILVRGNRIVAVGDVDVSVADRVIDLDGRTVMPGLIDIHAHHWGGTQDGEIIPPHRAESANYLAYGVTTVFDPAASSQTVFSAAEMTAVGKLTGPRLYSTGRQIIGAPRRYDIAGPEDAGRIADRFASWGALGLKQYYQPSRTQRQWLTQAARSRGDLLITGEGMDLAYDLGMIMDGQTAWEHPLLDIPIYSDVTRFLAQSGVVYNPELITPGQGLYVLEYYLARSDLPNDRKQRRWVHWEQLMRKKNHNRRPLTEYPAILSVAGVGDIMRAGGKVGIGGHGQEQGLGTHWEMWTLGFAVQPTQALAAATLGNARYLGLDRDLGSIETGKLADLLVLDESPLDDLRHSLTIRWVMQGGRLYDGETLDEEWPKQLAYGPRRWALPGAIAAIEE